MSTSITIRNVPDDVRDALAERAEKRGQSLQAYLVRELSSIATRVDQDELFRRVRERKSASNVRLTNEEIVDAVHADRR